MKKQWINMLEDAYGSYDTSTIKQMLVDGVVQADEKDDNLSQTIEQFVGDGDCLRDHELLRCAMNHGADTTYLLECAGKYGELKAAEIIIEHMKINKISKKRINEGLQYALSSAVQEGYAEMMELLVKNGAKAETLREQKMSVFKKDVDLLNNIVATMQLENLFK